MSHIFISYVEEEGQIVLSIARELEAAGFTAWYYERDSHPGLSYLIQTGEAIENSQAVILIISQNSIKSKQVTAEVVRAHECGKPFIPILFGITHQEFQQRQPEWREAIGSATSVKIPPEGISAILPRIILSLKKMMGEAVQSPIINSRPQDSSPVSYAPLAVYPDPSRRNKMLLKIAAAVVILAGLVAGGIAIFSPGATAPRPVFSSTSLQFPNVQLGARGGLQTLTVRNDGTKPVKIRNIEVSEGDKADFRFQTDDCLRAPIEPGFQCAINIYFAPKIAGSRNAALAVYTEGGRQPQTIALTGTALAPAVDVVSSLSFDNREVAQSDEKPLIIKNKGTAPLRIDKANIKSESAADFAIVANNCDNKLLPQGGECLLRIRFTPSAEGSRTATLVIAHNASDGEQTVALSGTATPRPARPTDPGRVQGGVSVPIIRDHRKLVTANRNQ